MKHYASATATLATIALLSVLGIAPLAQAQQCTVTGVAGSYAYSFSGFVSPAANVFVPAAATGRINFDGQGNVTGKQTRSVAGSALAETFSGTYTVNGDCTGSFTVVVQPDTRTSSVFVVWSNNHKNINAVFTSPGFTLTGTAERITAGD